MPKDQAQWFIPSTYAAFDARDHEVQRSKGSFPWLTLDVDGNNLSKSDMVEALGAVLGPCRYLIYSTSSATPENRKWRALVPLKEALAGADFPDTQRAFNDLLSDVSLGTLIADAALERTGQPVYLPNPLSGFYDYEVEKEAARLDLSPSHPVILRRDETRTKRAEAERAAEARRKQREAERAARPFGESETPIEAFNARHSVADLLERYGYTRAGRSADWRSPYQSSGSYATRCYDDYWVSLSGSDASAGLGNETRSGARHGDAFDLYCHFEHGGNFTKAAREYMAELKPQSFTWTHGAGQASTGLQDAHAGQEKAEEGLSGDKGEEGPQGPQEAHLEAPAATARRARPDPVTDRKGKPVWCPENACLILEHHEAWAGALAHDEFNALDMLLAPVPGTTVPKASFRPRPLGATDVTATLRWLNRNGFPDATRNVVEDALKAVAAQSIISPVRHYLEALTWDGKARISTWLQAYCQAPQSDLVGRFGRAWLIAAVARALRPGCKTDNALVLEGPQGAGKSSALKALAGEEWFFDGLRDLHNKDASAGLRGKWIIELPELSAMRRSVAEVVKAFLSRTEERYRPAYGKFEVVEPRRCVFAGTTNRSDYLADDTGGRRFWPVQVGKVDLAGLKRDRNQIWAEAVAAYQGGEPWWLDAEGEAAAAEIVAERQAEDPWSGRVLSLAAGLQEVSTAQIFDLMEMPVDRRARADAMRVGGILTRAGWGKGGKFKSGPYKDTTRYTAPPRGGEA
ncbi:MAG: hypothetical protein JNK19_08580 [Tabrizicola sp.]|nr:hypothetical protein [Tabrizicola sp.]